MNNIEIKKYSVSSIVSSIVISLAFLLLIWNMFHVNMRIKAFIGFLILLLVFFLSINVSYYLRFLGKRITALISIIITVVMLLSSPAVNCAMYKLHIEQYLRSIPADKSISLKINYTIEFVGGKGHIGSNWNKQHFFNDKAFGNGEVLTINADEAFVIKSRFTERDDYDDVGETCSQPLVYCPDNNTITFSQNVHVEEMGGRTNSGATADFLVSYTICRVIPPSMRFSRILLFAFDDTSKIINVCIVIWQIVCTFAIVYFIYKGKKKITNLNKT